MEQTFTMSQLMSMPGGKIYRFLRRVFANFMHSLNPELPLSFGDFLFDHWSIIMTHAAFMSKQKGAIKTMVMAHLHIMDREAAFVKTLSLNANSTGWDIIKQLSPDLYNALKGEKDLIDRKAEGILKKDKRVRPIALEFSFEDNSAHQIASYVDVGDNKFSRQALGTFEDIGRVGADDAYNASISKQPPASAFLPARDTIPGVNPAAVDKLLAAAPVIKKQAPVAPSTAKISNDVDGGGASDDDITRVGTSRMDDIISKKGDRVDRSDLPVLEFLETDLLST